MAEYVDKEKLYRYLDNEVEWKNNQDRLFALEVVQDEESADVAPVVHGKWLNFYGDFTCAECSKCGAIYDVVDVKPSREIFGEFEKEYKFCPNCGAKMDLEEDE